MSTTVETQAKAKKAKSEGPTGLGDGEKTALILSSSGERRCERATERVGWRGGKGRERLGESEGRGSGSERERGFERERRREPEEKTQKPKNSFT